MFLMQKIIIFIFCVFKILKCISGLHPWMCTIPAFVKKFHALIQKVLSEGVEI